MLYEMTLVLVTFFWSLLSELPSLVLCFMLVLIWLVRLMVSCLEGNYEI